MRKSFLAILLTSSVLAWAGDVTVSSPNGQLVVTVSETDGNITYAATLNGQPVITPSALGLKTNIGNFTEQLSMGDSKQSVIDNSYQMRGTKASKANYQANQLTVDLHSPL